MTRTSMIVALAVALSGCAAVEPSGSAGTTASPSTANVVGVNGTAAEAETNGGSTSTSMEEQRIKQQHGGTAPTEYVNQTHFSS